MSTPEERDAAWLTATIWRYTAHADGEIARVLLTSDNRVAVWSSFGYFAAFYSAPGPCFRRHLCEAAKHGTLASYLAPIAESTRARRREAAAVEAFVLAHVVPQIEAQLAAEQSAPSSSL